MGGSKSNPDEKILSYNDVVLRQSDIDILSGPYFLNDRIIEFFFSHLSSQHPSPEISLVSPAISFWITNCPAIETLEDFVGPLDLRTKKMILFPINDNDDVCRADGGSHWSLAVYHRDTNKFFHLDTNRGANEKVAKRLHEMVSGFVSGAEYVELTDTPQQTNGYDCGLYVTAIARVICRWYADGGDGGKDDLWISVVNEKVNSLAVSAMRDEILGLIRSLVAAK